MDEIETQPPEHPGKIVVRGDEDEDDEITVQPSEHVGKFIVKDEDAEGEKDEI